MAWDDLRTQLWGGNPMLSSLFVNHLLRHFGTGRERLCVGTDARGDPKAMAVVERVGIGRWQSFLPSQAQLGPTLARSLGDIYGVVNCLPGRALQLDLLCNDSRFGDLTGNSPSPNSTWHALTTSIELAGDFNSYWAARPAKTRQNADRHKRKLSSSGLLEFVVIKDTGDMAEALQRYGALESAGWKGRVGTALSPGSAQFAFYRSLMHEAARANAGRVFELWWNGRLLASRLALIDAQMLVMLKTTYSEEHASYSPGQVLLRCVVEHAFDEHQGKRIEFYTNASRQQEAWSTSTRAIRHVSISRFARWREVTSARRALVSRTARAMGRDFLLRHDESSLSVERFASIDALPGDALRLFNETERQYGVQTGADWFRNLCVTVPPLGQSATIEVLRRRGEAVAILPLVRRSGNRTGIVTLAALGNFYTSLYAPPIRRDVPIYEMAYLLRQALKAVGVTEMELGPMDPHAREFSLLRAAMSMCGLVVFPTFYFGNWTLPRPASLGSYMASRPGSLRSTLRRKGKRFTDAGGRIEILSSEQDVARGLRAYEEVYAASWKQPEPFPAFIPGIAKLAARHGWLRLGIAWLNERPIAVQLWIVARGRAEIFKLAYSEQFKPYSAGTLLSAALIEEALSDPNVELVDYLSGDDAYKRDWMTRRGERWGLSAYDPASSSGLSEISSRILARMVSNKARN